MYDKNYVDDCINKTAKLILMHSNIIKLDYDDPFMKIDFIEKLIKLIDYEIIYLDCDLLYTGYNKSGISDYHKNVIILQPTTESIIDCIKYIALQITKKKCLVIIDSLNNFSNLFCVDSGIRITTSIMLFASLAKISESNVLFSSKIESEDINSFVLSVVGTYVIKPEKLFNVTLKSEFKKTQ